MKVLSLFDGISCARVALNKFGYKDVTYYASEIDKYAIQISQKNWPDIVQLGDVKNVTCDSEQDTIEVGEPDLSCIDLLIGGSPCQDLSIAKKNRKGLSGERSGLFWEYVRILKEVKPTYFVLENVNSMPKEAKDTITEALGVEPIMINAALVSAQNRKRLFWTNIPGVTQPVDRGMLLKDILEENVDEKYTIKNINLVGSQSNIKKELNFVGGIRNKDWAKDGKDYSRNFGQGDRVYSPDGKSTTLSALGGGRGAKTGLYLVVPEATKRGHAIAIEGQSVDLSFPTSKTRRGRVGDKVKNLMTSQNIGVFTEGIIRKLTPIECERLQSLPDDYTKGVSNTQRYKALGNAFNVDVIAHILSFIK